MKKSTFALVSCCLPLLSYSAAPTEPPAGFLLNRESVIAAAKAVTATRYPNADCALVDDHGFVRYETNGTSVAWDDEYLKILTEKGRRDSAARTYSFDTNYGTSLVWRVEILKPDGRIIPIDVATYARVSIDAGQMGMNIYDPSSKDLALAIPGLEVGDIRHIVYCSITTKAYFKNTWGTLETFENDQPVVKFDYEVSSPNALPIRRQFLRAAVTNTLVAASMPEPTGDRTRYSWHVRNVPQMFPEPDMPPAYTQVQRILLSTVNDWREVSRWYWDLCKKAMADITPEMKTKVAELTKGAATREEKIQRLFKFVSQEIRYMGITTEAVSPGYEPHPVSVTFSKRYGVCRDKAALLAALLNLAGIKAYPVLIEVGPKLDPDAPLPYFNHAITAVERSGGGYQLMDSTAENTREYMPAYLCDKSYLIAKPEGETLLTSEVYPAERNLTRIVSEGDLDSADALTMHTRIAFEGINDNAYRGYFLSHKPDQRRRFFETILQQRLAGAELLSVTLLPADLQDITKPLNAELTYRIPDFAVRGRELDVATLPWLGVSIGCANMIVGRLGLEKRTYPLQTELTCGTEERITLNVGSRLGAPRLLPPAVNLVRTGVSFTQEQALTNGVFSGSFRYLLTRPEFSPGDYLALKQTLRDVEAAWRRRALFEAVPSVQPDTEMLFYSLDKVIRSPSEWVATNTFVKRVLTYAGKKNAAEIKLPFNPAWQKLSIVSATVSNLDGRVHALEPVQQHVMDASWVGSAPRYPAGKLLVANLPSVETGSVISVTIAMSSRQEPFFSWAFSFGGTDPIREEQYRLTWPKDLTPAMGSFQDAGIEKTCVTNGSSITASWHLRHPPTFRAEDSLPPRHFFTPSVFISCGNWNDYARLLKDAIESASKTDSFARETARRLIKGVKGDAAKLRVLRDAVLRTIRSSGVSFTELPLVTLSSPDRTLTDSYGHHLDRAILLATFLDEAGFDPEIVLASADTTELAAYAEPHRRYPQRTYFSIPLVKVAIDGQSLFLNDGTQYSEPGASASDGAPCITLRGKLDRIRVPEPFRDRGFQEETIDLAADGTATLTVTNRYFGTAIGSFRKRYQEMLPEDRRRHQLDLVSEISRAGRIAGPLVTQTTAAPYYRAYALTAANFASVTNGILTLLLPQTLATPLYSLRGETRENPFFLEREEPTTFRCHVILPAGFTKLTVVPEPKHWSLPCGLGTCELSTAQSLRPDGRTELLFTRSETHGSAVLDPQLFPALLSFNRSLSHPSTRLLVVEKP